MGAGVRTRGTGNPGELSAVLRFCRGFIGKTPGRLGTALLLSSISPRPGYALGGWLTASGMGVPTLFPSGCPWWVTGPLGGHQARGIQVELHSAPEAITLGYKALEVLHAFQASVP